MPILATLKFNIPEGIEIQLKDRLEKITLESLITRSYGELVRDILDTLTEWEDLPEARYFIDDKLKSFIIYARDRIIEDAKNRSRLRGAILLSLAANAVTEKQTLWILSHLLRDDTREYDRHTSAVLGQILVLPHKVKTSKIIIKIIDILQQCRYSSSDLISLDVKEEDGAFETLEGHGMNFVAVGDALIKIFNYMLEHRTNELQLALPVIIPAVEKYLNSIKEADLVINDAFFGDGDESATVYDNVVIDGMKKKEEIANTLLQLPQAIADIIKDSLVSLVLINAPTGCRGRMLVHDTIPLVQGYITDLSKLNSILNDDAAPVGIIARTRPYL